jgi:hypothetical protein
VLRFQQAKVRWFPTHAQTARLDGAPGILARMAGLCFVFSKPRFGGFPPMRKQRAWMGHAASILACGCTTWLVIPSRSFDLTHGFVAVDTQADDWFSSPPD